MLLDIEKDLKKHQKDIVVEIILSSKDKGIVEEIHKAAVGSFLVKTGGGKKGGSRLGASIRRKVIKHLEDGGRVDLVVLATTTTIGEAHKWLK